MSDDRQAWRDRARECRKIAAETRDPKQRAFLEQIADELDAEADKAEAELKLRIDSGPSQT